MANEPLHARIARFLRAWPYAWRIKARADVDEDMLTLVRAAHLQPKALRDAHRILETLPGDLIEEFAELYRSQEHGTRSTKYYNLPVRVIRAARQARQLGLGDAPRPLTILDVGTGFGYFPLVCSHLGHRSVGLDHYEKKVYQEIVDRIDIERVTWKVTAEEPLPQLGYLLDLVTAFSPTFYYDYESERLWDVEKWRAFLTGLRKSLAPDGRVFIGSNTVRDGQKGDYDAMSEYFESLKARPHQRGWLFEAVNLP